MTHLGMPQSYKIETWNGIKARPDRLEPIRATKPNKAAKCSDLAVKKYLVLYKHVIIIAESRSNQRDDRKNSGGVNFFIGIGWLREKNNYIRNWWPI